MPLPQAVSILRNNDSKEEKKGERENRRYGGIILHSSQNEKHALRDQRQGACYDRNDLSGCGLRHISQKDSTEKAC